jgi:AbrB family looped-hinge helix DNA binding protein
MESTVEVARRGQITIPKRVRDDLRIEEGQKYHIRALKSGVLVFTPRRGKATAALAQMRAALTEKNVSLEEMLAELRRLREQNEI